MFRLSESFDKYWRTVMKKIFFLVIVCSTLIFSQGLTRTPYDSVGWSLPAGYTPYYGLYIFNLLSNPGGRINLNTQKIDSLLHALIVYTDTKNLIIRNDTLIISDTASGIHAFTSTNNVDSVAIVGFDSLDVLIASPMEAAYNVNDILFIEKRTGYFKVWRNSGGSSGLKYNWIWIRKYQ